MKTLASVIIAAALVVPAAASAQRTTTPGTFDRHAQNLEQAEETSAEERRMANNESEVRVPAAKAGKVNVATSATSSAS